MPPHVFIAMYALGTGLIKGFNKQCCLMAGWSHLAQKKGLVSGIILGGYGFGGSLYGLYYHNKIAQVGSSSMLEPIFDDRDGNLYFPKEVGARYPDVHKRVVTGILIVSLMAIALVSNYSMHQGAPASGFSKLKRFNSSFTLMTPAKRERLTVLSKRYIINKVEGDV